MTPAQLSQIKKALQGKPKDVGVIADRWNGETLSKWITQKMGITLQGRQCQGLLHKFGFANKWGGP